MRLLALVSPCLTLALAGCALAPSATPSPQPGVAFGGVVHGGQQPIAGARIYLFAAAITGYGQPSVSLLTSGDGADTTGTYVLTGGDGTFNITASEYACSPGRQVYAYSLGGDPGAGANAAAGLLAILGNCPSAGNFLGTVPFIVINEVSTVAAAFAFAGFANDPTHVSSRGSALARTGIANAFANAANLASLGTGEALAVTPAGNGFVPQSILYSLADILAACVNSNGGTTTVNSGNTSTVSTAPCGTLFSYATLDGTQYGTQPADTASAALNIAHHPGSNVGALFSLQGSSPPFPLDLSSAPNDWTIAIDFTAAALNAGGQNTSGGIAVDALGNVWVVNGPGGVTEFSPLGVVLSGSQGYGTAQGSLIAIDSSGDAWVTNNGAASVTEFSPGGSVLSGSNGFAAGAGPFAIAIDGASEIWITDQFSNTDIELASDGSTAATFSGGDQNDPTDIALDASGDAWIANAGGFVTRIAAGGTVTSTLIATQYTPFGIAVDASGDIWVSNSAVDSVTRLNNSGGMIGTYTGGGLDAPAHLSVDGAGDIWVANGGRSSGITELSNSGIAMSPSSGFGSIRGTMNGGLNRPQALAVDGSGDLWVANTSGPGVFEFLGIATPVVTPLADGVANNTLGSRP
jgi:streptogramin lyase